MYPKLRPDVYVAPAEGGGVFVAVDGKKVALKGNNVLPLLERLSPFLDGTRTLESILAPLPEDKRRFVHQVITMLLEASAIRDVSEDRAHVLDEALAQTYATSLNYLETLAEGARRRFLRLRDTQVAVLGGGAAGRTLATALCEAGVRQGVVALPPGDVHAALLKDNLASHAKNDAQSDWRTQEVSGPGADVVRGASLVVGFGTAEELERMQALCLEQGVALLPVVYAAGFGTIGPVVRPGRAGCFQCARERIRFSPPNDPPSAQAWSFLGARAAVEAFNVLAELPSECEQGVVRINGETLNAVVHPLQPVGNCPACREAGKGPTLAVEARELRELPEAFQAWISPFSGLLAGVDAEDWPQLPLSLWAARGQEEGPAVLAPGKDHESAKARCVLAALTSALPEQPPEDAPRGLVRGSAPGELLPPEKSPRGVVWYRCAGLGFGEWVGQGLLAQACHEVLPESRGRKLTAAELGVLDEDAGFWWKTLSLRYDLEVEAWRAAHPSLPVSVVQLMAGGQPLAKAAGRSEAEALKTAVLVALGTVQARAAKGAESRFVVTPPGVAQRVEPSAGETPSWSDWLRQLGERPLHLAVEPRNPGLRALGLYVGWVGVPSGA